MNILNEKKLVTFDNIQHYHDNLSNVIDGKQDSLISGTNIKTVNGESILGSGNIVIESGENIPYLTIDVLEDDCTIEFYSPNDDTIQYSTDLSTWNDLAEDGTVSANAGDKVYFKAHLIPLEGEGIGAFTVSKNFNLSGNCNSMLFGDDAANNLDLTGYNCAFLYLFGGNTTLQSVSRTFLPATILAASCYRGMFDGCTSLTTAPELPATTLAGGCYRGMFDGCTSLTTAPELPATTLAPSCYSNMFSGCAKLNYIKAMFTTTPGSRYTSNWVSGVSSTGTFVKNKNAAWDNTGESGIPTGWTIEYPLDILGGTTDQILAKKSDITNDTEWTSVKTINGKSILGSGNIAIESGETDVPYLTIEALEDDCTIGFSMNTIQYSTDLYTWSDLTPGNTVSANAGDKVYFKASGLTPTSSAGIGTFTVNKKFNLSGNCNSMLFGDDAASNLDLTGYNYAFCNLFYNSTTLQSVLRTFLPATTLTMRCYYSMFRGCSSLITAPELPATILGESCYQNMFHSCSSLTTAPELPATTLSFGGYSAMFSGCSSLTTAPSILPATTMTTWCYKSMFQNCTSLTTAPELPATTLAQECCLNMFRDCTNLNYIKMLATDITAENCLSYWVNGVSSSGTFIKNAAATWTTTGVSGIPSGWTVEYPLDISGGTTDQILAKKSDTTNDTEWTSVKTINGKSILGSGNIVIESGENGVPYLTIEVLEDECTIGFSMNTIQYSTDLSTWNDLAVGSTVSANAGDKVYFKATGLVPSTSRPNHGIGTFTVSKNFNLSGNCNSMLFGDDAATNLDLTGYDYAFYYLFGECTTLQSVSSTFLPVTTLAIYCYSYMFSGCTALTTAPELPATTLTGDCYWAMFSGCTSLTTAPELPATTLADYCYDSMFSGCTSLTTAPELPATTLANRCYAGMFEGCTALTTAPDLPATTLAYYCYSYMFYGCTSLTIAPELPATTLATSCYRYMFQNCSSLTTAPTELPATTLADSCYSYMFYGCTSLTIAPELPATTLTISCYYNMFYDCSKLDYIKMLATSISVSNCLYKWVSGVSSMGKFVKNKNATWTTTGVSGIPSGWTVEYPLDISGGTSDQILTKKSGITHDTNWTSVKTINKQSILGSGNITIETDANVAAVDDETTIIDVDINKYIIETTNNNITLTNNTYWRKTNISSYININFELPEDDTIFTSYNIEFTTSNSGTTITLPDTVKWLNGNAPLLENNTTYQISVMNNLGVCAKYT